MITPFDLIQALRSWFYAKDAAIYTGGKDIDTGGGDIIVGSGSVDGVDLTSHVADVDAHHTESHTVASHSDTTGTGSELNTLTDGSDAGSLHIHDARYFQESEFSDTPGSNSKPLESDSNGYLELEGLGAGTTPTAGDVNALDDVTAGDDMRAGGNISAAGGITSGSFTISPQGTIYLKEVSAPGTPASGNGVLYVKTDGKLYFKNDAGTETALT